MAVKLTEQTNGPHIFMRLRLDSGRVEEIDAYISEEGWRYVTAQTAPRRYGCGSLRRFIRCIDLLSIHFKGRMPFFGVLSLLAHKDVI